MHQSNLARRAAKEAADAPVQPAPQKAGVDIKKFVKIGRPGYRVTKQRDPENGQQSLLFEIDYPEIAEGIVPRHRFMSAYEQKVEPRTESGSTCSSLLNPTRPSPSRCPPGRWTSRRRGSGPTGTGRPRSSSCSSVSSCWTREEDVAPPLPPPGPAIKPAAAPEASELGAGDAATRAPSTQNVMLCCEELLMSDSYCLHFTFRSHFRKK